MSMENNLRTAQNFDGPNCPASLAKKWSYYTNWSKGGPPQKNTDVGIDASVEWEMDGTSAASLTSCLHDPRGGLKCLTAGADNDQVILSPHVDTAQSSLEAVTISTSKEAVFFAHVMLGATITTVLYNLGFKLTANLDETTDDDAAFFSFDTDSSDTNWQCNVSIGGTDTEYDSGVPIVASTHYTLMVVIGSDRKPRFYIDDGNQFRGQQRATGGAMTAAVGLKPVIGVQALSGIAQDMYPRCCAVSKLW